MRMASWCSPTVSHRSGRSACTGHAGDDHRHRIVLGSHPFDARVPPEPRPLAARELPGPPHRLVDAPRGAAPRPPRAPGARGSRAPGGLCATVHPGVPQGPAPRPGIRRPSARRSAPRSAGRPRGGRGAGRRGQRGPGGSARDPDRSSRTDDPIRRSPRGPGPADARCSPRSGPRPPGRVPTSRSWSPATATARAGVPSEPLESSPARNPAATPTYRPGNSSPSVIARR